MYYYNFTNDLRISTLTDSIKEAAQLIVSNSVPSASVDKSKNNNVNTLAFYFNLKQDNNCAKYASTGYVREVVLNFIKKFQFPNTRTSNDLNNYIANGQKLAPMREIIKVLNLLDSYTSQESYLTVDEIRLFIFYNDTISKHQNYNLVTLVQDINNYRESGIIPSYVHPNDLETHWKHEQRQIREMLKLLIQTGYVTESNGRFAVSHDNLTMGNKAGLFDITKYNDYWDPDSNISYQEYMDMPQIENHHLVNISTDNNIVTMDIKQFLIAARTKPFILLAGISGTGKSRIVRKLAQATDDIDTFAKDNERWECHAPENFKLIQVKPNWHNSMDVVGYKSNIGGEHYEFTPFVEFVAKAWQYPNTPFFLCLDEMNLAPVEEYFAEYLSAIESRTIENGAYETDPIIKPFKEFGESLSAKMITKLLGNNSDNDIAKRFREKGLTLPQNLIVMGTVNMDDTTFSFSRKVLDRAMSIEMNEVNYDAFLNGDTEDDVPKLVDKNTLLIDRPVKGTEVKDDVEADKVMQYLKDINEVLDGTPFKLGYRAANEALLYVSAAQTWGNDDLAEALDQFTLMKILSRIEGDESKLMADDDKTILDCLKETIEQHLAGEDRKCLKKIAEMAKILQRDHFVSYWA